MFNKNPDFKTLLHGGYVKESGEVQSVACLECDIPHDAEFIYEQDRYGYYCTELGFVPVAREWIVGLKPSLPTIVSNLADALECKRRKSTPVQGETWRIGAVASEGGDVSIYLHPSLNGEHDVVDLMAALSREVRTPFRLILTAAGTLPIPDANVVSLGDVVEVNSGQAKFVVLSDPRDIVARQSG